MDRKLWWIVAGVAGVALLALWLIDKSPMDGSFKSVAKRTVATGAALSVVALLATVALLGLPAPLGLLAAGSMLVGTGAFAVIKHAVAGSFDGPVCPPGATPLLTDDGELWCSCTTLEGSVALFRAGTEPDSPCLTATDQ